MGTRILMIGAALVVLLMGQYAQCPVPPENIPTPTYLPPPEYEDPHLRGEPPNEITGRGDSGPITGQGESGPITGRGESGPITGRGESGPITGQGESGPITGEGTPPPRPPSAEQAQRADGQRPN
jgi:hypothetical protein